MSLQGYNLDDNFLKVVVKWITHTTIGFYECNLLLYNLLYLGNMICCRQLEGVSIQPKQHMVIRSLAITTLYSHLGWRTLVVQKFYWNFHPILDSTLGMMVDDKLLHFSGVSTNIQCLDLVVVSVFDPSFTLPNLKASLASHYCSSSCCSSSTNY